MSKLPIPLPALSIVIKIVVIVLALAFISEKSGKLETLDFTAGDTWANMKVVSLFWFTLLPQGLYLCAVWAASNVFGRIGRGDAFGPAMVKGLRETGSCLVYGALLAILIIPTLYPMLSEHSRGVRYNLEIESVTIGLVGVVLYLLARQGQALKAELEQFV
ncbi:DUF2975 domain-containing protein [Asticcacaulis sp. AC402]|uniref:DUF2975 domain-containing protein n=1 Tax=Asticcacaulis sp. AC402 TaxID=1282361 RepID=UPI0003F4B8B8|nr:DUF2975 domain-containing protein [Asticcacaulis sp. AC402]